MMSESPSRAPAGAPPRGARVSPHFLVTLTMFLWSTNIVLGRALRADVPPAAISFWRWGLAALIFLPVAWPHLRRGWPEVRRRWKALALLGVLLIVGGNMMLYAAVQFTEAVNVGIMNAAQPVMTALLAWAILRVRLAPLQAFGIALSFAGVLAIVARGDLAVLLALRLNPGDLLMLVAITCWALYTVLYRFTAPALHPLAFLEMVMVFGALASLPLYVAESALWRPMTVDLATLGMVAYTAVFASIVAVLFWNRAIAEIGPNKAAIYINLMAVFAALLAVPLLGEPFELYHLAGFVLVCAGIVLMTR